MKTMPRIEVVAHDSIREALAYRIWDLGTSVALFSSSSGQRCGPGARIGAPRNLRGIGVRRVADDARTDRIAYHDVEDSSPATTSTSCRVDWPGVPLPHGDPYRAG